MTKWLMKIGMKFLSYDALVGIIASAMAHLLEYARKRATPEAWENAKGAVKKIRNWATLLDEVYEDDTLTSEEEQRIEEEISKCTAMSSIYNILTGKKAPAKQKAPLRHKPKTAKKVLPKPAKTEKKITTKRG